MLPINLPLGPMQTRWKAEIDPVLVNPLNGVSVLQNVALKSGTNVINHLLGKTQQGWFLTDIQGAATVYRSAPFSNTTLTLHSSADVTVSIGVY